MPENQMKQTTKWIMQQLSIHTGLTHEIVVYLNCNITRYWHGTIIYVKEQASNSQSDITYSQPTIIEYSIAASIVVNVVNAG